MTDSLQTLKPRKTHTCKKIDKKPRKIKPTTTRQSKPFNEVLFKKKPNPVKSKHDAPIAQLDRASVYETEGYLFESSWVYFS
jgi:hypothetical protein